ncbi:MAG: Rrf2 family transcriptional regulator [Candidatus Pacebacteria bacterium]|nr:Rrf2 family transcriptional regulator [Candidatus Paceibacterota bacterium]
MIFTPTTRQQLALEAVLDIAYHSLDNLVQSSDITARQAIPRRSLEPVLQHLTRAGILAGVRGPRGGYRLAREKRRITVADVFRAVNGADEASEANRPDQNSANDYSLGARILMPLWHEVSQEVQSGLEKITLESLCSQAQKLGIKSQARRSSDFTI